MSKFESQDEPAVASLQPLSSVATTALVCYSAIFNWSQAKTCDSCLTFTRVTILQLLSLNLVDQQWIK